MLDKPSDIWNVMDNQQRPAIVMLTTIALDPHVPTTSPVVRAREIRFGQAAEPELAQKITEQAKSGSYWTIGGVVRSQQPLSDISVTVVESGQKASFQDGRFAIGNLRPGDYTLEIAAEGRQPSRHKITVPAPDYDFDL
jgi:hypothetical protein